MPDYGHDLRFGTFITPSNANPQAPVALAQLSEQLGFDLATFQDHPYQAAFLDAWTLSIVSPLSGRLFQVPCLLRETLSCGGLQRH